MIFPLTSVSRPAVRPTQPPVQWVPGSFSRGKARPERDADHSPHLVPKSRMSRSYTSSIPSATMTCSGTALLFALSIYRSIWGRSLYAPRLKRKCIHEHDDKNGPVRVDSGIIKGVFRLFWPSLSKINPLWVFNVLRITVWKPQLLKKQVSKNE
jgi:hypothetical protein